MGPKQFALKFKFLFSSFFLKFKFLMTVAHKISNYEVRAVGKGTLLYVLASENQGSVVILEYLL